MMTVKLHLNGCIYDMFWKVPFMIVYSRWGFNATTTLRKFAFNYDYEVKVCKCPSHCKLKVVSQVCSVEYCWSCWLPCTFLAYKWYNLLCKFSNLLGSNMGDDFTHHRCRKSYSSLNRINTKPNSAIIWYDIVAFAKNWRSPNGSWCIKLLLPTAKVFSPLEPDARFSNL